jgi:hypothetical protein
LHRAGREGLQTGFHCQADKEYLEW